MASINISIIIILIILLMIMSKTALNYRKRIYGGYHKSKYLEKSKLNKIELSDLSPLFVTNEYGPTTDSEVKFIGRGNIYVPGGTTDTETWILSVLAKNAKIMFEFGTCTGKTAYLWALNSSDDAKVYTLTLPPTEAEQMNKQSESDSDLASKNAVNESNFDKFIYTGTEAERKIVQIFCDSKDYSEKELTGKVDLIFIDGSHAYSYIKSDTQKALKMLSPKGIILWHDYHLSADSIDVWRYLNELSNLKPVYSIPGTTLAVYKSE